MYRLLLILPLFALVALAVPAPVSAQGAGGGQYSSASDIPLVVIRFNQRKVFFERPLYNAVSKAVSIKPNVMLDVVSFIPQASSEDGQERVNASAASQQASVVNALLSMGVPRGQIRTSRDVAPDTQFHEVYVYVQ
ncbi:MAG: hypothetical protein U1E36_05040 [Rickettsiales bacterium]